MLTIAETTWLSADEEAELRAELRAKERATLARLETHRMNLVDLLTDRFGALPRSVTERILACDEEDKLRQAVRSSASIASLDQLKL